MRLAAPLVLHQKKSLGSRIVWSPVNINQQHTGKEGFYG
jgi:hypothetical protein